MHLLTFSLLLACADPGSDSALADPLDAVPTPCGRAAVAALALAADGRGWLACGAALFATSDAGASFVSDAPAPGAEVAALLLEPDGALLACGREPRGPGLLWRRGPSGGWTRELAAGDVAGLRVCGSVARAADGALAVTGPRQAVLALRATPGAPWRQPGGWWEGGEPPRLFDLGGSDAGWAAVGAGLVGPPTFLASRSAAEPLPLLPQVPAADLVGELWALASPDGGATWIAGGRELGEEDVRAVLLRSDDRGARWRRLALPEGPGWVRDLAFGPDGRCGVAVGQRAWRAEGGFVLVSADGGERWVEVDAALADLRAAAVLDGGFVVGGADGTLARGWCP